MSDDAAQASESFYHAAMASLIRSCVIVVSLFVVDSTRRRCRSAVVLPRRDRWLLATNHVEILLVDKSVFPKIYGQIIDGFFYECNSRLLAVFGGNAVLHLPQFVR